MMGFCNQSVAERILSVPPLMYMFDPVAAVHRSSSAHASQSIRRLLVGKPSLLASSIRSPIGVRLGERKFLSAPAEGKRHYREAHVSSGLGSSRRKIQGRIRVQGHPHSIVQ